MQGGGKRKVSFALFPTAARSFLNSGSVFNAEERIF
jgi:hypothetical protein